MLMSIPLLIKIMRLHFDVSAMYMICKCCQKLRMRKRYKVVEKICINCTTNIFNHFKVSW